MLYRFLLLIVLSLFIFGCVGGEVTSPEDGSVAVVPDKPVSWKFTERESNRTHIFSIENSSETNILGDNLNIGDFVGAFFETEDDYQCAGYVEWNGDSAILVAWGDNTEYGDISEKKGFDAGEKVLWIVRRVDDKNNYLLEADFNKGEIFFVDNGISEISSFYTDESMIIQ